MPAVWFALKRSMHCKSSQSDVHDPKRRNNLSNISTKKTSIRSGCSRSIANLKDVMIHGSSKRHIEKPPICSPRSIGSSELLNPITHEVVLDDATCELKIRTAGDYGKIINGDGNNFVGMLKPGTPGPQRRQKPGISGSSSPMRRSSGSNLSRRSYSCVSSRHVSRSSFGQDFSFNGGLCCHKCGERFVRWEAVEEHHLSNHAVTELPEGDSSRKIVEIICQASCTNKPDNNNIKIERILKVHNMQKSLAQFEDYRELVKIKASKLNKKHPRCLADGNELLRFHGSTVHCTLGSKGSSSLCTSDKCRVCQVLRHGFSIKREMSGGVGVFTASTSVRAFESIKADDDDDDECVRKALIVCRVIAGRVHRPLENIQEMVGQSGFDSLAGKVGQHWNIEELYLLSPRALLPCFVVIYKSRGN